MAPGLIGLALCTIILICTVVPYISLEEDELDSIETWATALEMFHQVMLWSCARTCSFPFMELLHAAVMQLPVVGSLLVCLLGESLGSAFQYYIFDVVLAPLVAIKDKTVKNALKQSPLLFTMVLHLTHIGSFAPWMIAIGLPFFGNSWNLTSVVAGGTATQLLLLTFRIITVKLPATQPVIFNTIIPGLRCCADALITYWIWRERKALQESSDMSTDAEVADVKRYRRLSLKAGPPPSPAALAAQPVMSRRGGGREKVTVTPGPTPSKKTSYDPPISLDSIRRRLQTNLSESIYDTPSTAQRRSARLAERG